MSSFRDVASGDSLDDRSIVRFRAVIVAVVAALLGWALTACGANKSDDVKLRPKTHFRADLNRVGGLLRIRWSVTNADSRPILVFDGIRPGDGVFDPYRGNGAFVTGRPDDTVEIAMRAFPVSAHAEGVVQYGFTATRLPPGRSTSGNLVVVLPFHYNPAAPVAGGGDPLPKHPKRAVFCVGVMVDRAGPARSAKRTQHPWVAHDRQVADAQTLLCSQPARLTGGESPGTAYPVAGPSTVYVAAVPVLLR